MLVILRCRSHFGLGSGQSAKRAALAAMQQTWETHCRENNSLESMQGQ